MSRAVPLPTARPLGRAVRVPQPCVPGAVGAGVGTEHRFHSVRPCGLALLAVGVAEGRFRGGVKGSSGQDRTSLKACVFPRIRFVMFTAILSLRYCAQYLAVLTHVCYRNPYIILSRCGADPAFWALHGTRAH